MTTRWLAAAMAALVVAHPTAAQDAGASGAQRGGFTLLLTFGWQLL